MCFLFVSEMKSRDEVVKVVNIQRLSCQQAVNLRPFIIYKRKMDVDEFLQA